MLALTVPLPAEVLVGLNARDTALFEAQLQAAHEVGRGAPFGGDRVGSLPLARAGRRPPLVGIASPLSQGFPEKGRGLGALHRSRPAQALVAHIAAESARVASELEAGPLSEAQHASEAAASQLEAARAEAEAARAEREADAAAFDEGLRRVRRECGEGAEVARQESLSLLRGEVAQLKVRPARRAGAPHGLRRPARTPKEAPPPSRPRPWPAPLAPPAPARAPTLRNAPQPPVPAAGAAGAARGGGGRAAGRRRAPAQRARAHRGPGDPGAGGHGRGAAGAAGGRGGARRRDERGDQAVGAARARVGVASSGAHMLGAHLCAGFS